MKISYFENFSIGTLREMQMIELVREAGAAYLLPVKHKSNQIGRPKVEVPEFRLTAYSGFSRG